MFKEFKNFEEGFTCFFIYLLLDKILNISIGIWLQVFSITVHDNGMKGILLTKFEAEPFYVLKLILIFAFVEEVTYRLFPALIILICLKTFPFLEKEKEELMLLTLLISSAIFGYDHGDYTNMLIQGVSGILFFTFFCRSGGFTSGKLLVSLASVTLLHFSTNALTLGILSLKS